MTNSMFNQIVQCVQCIHSNSRVRNSVGPLNSYKILYGNVLFCTAGNIVSPVFFYITSTISIIWYELNTNVYLKSKVPLIKFRSRYHWLELWCPKIHFLNKFNAYWPNDDVGSQPTLSDSRQRHFEPSNIIDYNIQQQKCRGIPIWTVIYHSGN